MANLLSTAVANLNAALKSAAGETVTYRRGNDAISGLSAVPVRVRQDDFPIDGANITAREQDWIIWADDLAIAGQFITPRRNDEIDWTDPRGVKRTFRVLPRLGERCYRFTDQSKQQFRTYTVEQLPNSE